MCDRCLEMLGYIQHSASHIRIIIHTIYLLGIAFSMWHRVCIFCTLCKYSASIYRGTYESQWSHIRRMICTQLRGNDNRRSRHQTTLWCRHLHPRRHRCYILSSVVYTDFHMVLLCWHKHDIIEKMKLVKRYCVKMSMHISFIMAEIFLCNNNNYISNKV